jgi:chromosome partitioning protein
MVNLLTCFPARPDLSKDGAMASIPPGHGSIVALSNRKGGCGKTTVTLGLARALVLLGVRTLVVDLGDGGKATRRVGAELRIVDGQGVTTSDLLLHEEIYPVSEVVVPTTWGFDLAPGDDRFGGSDVVRSQTTVTRMRSCLEGHGYGIVLIDSAPTLSVLALNALAAADFVLGITEPGYDSALDVVEMLTPGEGKSTLEDIRERYGARAELAGVIVTLMKRTAVAAAAIDDHNGGGLQAVFGDLLWRPFIMEHAAIAESAASGIPLDLEPVSRASGATRCRFAFEDLARRLLAAEAELLSVSAGAIR